MLQIALFIFALDDEVVVLYKFDSPDGDHMLGMGGLESMLLLLLLLALPLRCSTRPISGVEGPLAGDDVTHFGPAVFADGGDTPLGEACIGLLLRSVEGVQSYVSSRVGLLSVDRGELCPLSCSCVSFSFYSDSIRQKV